MKVEILGYNQKQVFLINRTKKNAAQQPKFRHDGVTMAFFPIDLGKTVQ